jgi:hypothetical protein
MGREPIGDVAMTSAERQQRHRAKIVKKMKEQTPEAVEREEKRIKERCCDMIYMLGGTNHLYVMEALLYNLTAYKETPEEKRMRVINMSGYIKALVDFDQEIIDGWDGEE